MLSFQEPCFCTFTPLVFCKIPLQLEIHPLPLTLVVCIYPLQLNKNLQCMWVLWYLLRGVYSFSTLPACWSRGVFSGCLKLHCPLASFACRFHCTPGSRTFRDEYTKGPPAGVHSETNTFRVVCCSLRSRARFARAFGFMM